MRREDGLAEGLAAAAARAARRGTKSMRTAATLQHASPRRRDSRDKRCKRGKRDSRASSLMATICGPLMREEEQVAKGCGLGAVSLPRQPRPTRQPHLLSSCTHPRPAPWGAMAERNRHRRPKAKKRWHDGMTTMACLRGFIFSLSVAAAQAGPWHLVDVPALVCPGGPSETKVTFLLDQYGGPTLDLPFVLTFYRTTDQAVNFQFALMDATQQVVVPMTPIMLSPINASSPVTTPPPLIAADARRLGRLGDTSFDNVAFATAAAAAGPLPEEGGEGDGCETFFLMDGRAPVELPDTWGEAQSAFRDMCAAEGYSAAACGRAEAKVFDGYSQDLNEPLRPDAALCERLLSFAAAVTQVTATLTATFNDDEVPLVPIGGLTAASLASFSAAPRRMKGSWGSYSSDGYGYSAPRLSRAYPLGYASTPYGYTGYRAYPRYNPIMVYLPFYPLGYHPGYYSRYSNYCGAGSCTPTRAGNCNVGSTVPGEETLCEWNYTLPNDANRDDIMDTGFIPSEFNWPLTLIITRPLLNSIGVDFAPENICPPVGMTADQAMLWQPAVHEDLYVTLTMADPDDPGPFWWLSSALGMIACGCFTCCVIKILCTGTVCSSGSGGYEEVELAGSSSPTRSGALQGANGLLYEGSRVRTQWTAAEGGDGSYYEGCVVSAHEDGTVTLRYDDGTSWNGRAENVELIVAPGMR